MGQYPWTGQDRTHPEGIEHPTDGPSQKLPWFVEGWQSRGQDLRRTVEKGSRQDQIPRQIQETAHIRTLETFLRDDGFDFTLGRKGRSILNVQRIVRRPPHFRGACRSGHFLLGRDFSSGGLCCLGRGGGLLTSLSHDDVALVVTRSLVGVGVCVCVFGGGRTAGKTNCETVGEGGNEKARSDDGSVGSDPFDLAFVSGWLSLGFGIEAAGRTYRSPHTHHLTYPAKMYVRYHVVQVRRRNLPRFIGFCVSRVDVVFV